MHSTEKILAVRFDRHTASVASSPMTRRAYKSMQSMRDCVGVYSQSARLVFRHVVHHDLHACENPQHRLCSRLQTSSECFVDKIGQLLAVFEVQSTIAPSGAKLLERGTLKLCWLIGDQVNVILDQAVADWVVTQ